MTTFSADEIFEMAEQIERNGARFYRKAAEAIQAAEARELVGKLAEMEVDHERTFAQIRKDLAGPDYAPTGHSPDDPGYLYLRAIVDGRIFDPDADPCDLLGGDESLETIFRLAIGLEKDSIVFYAGMREMVPGRAEKDKIDEIMRQEMGHIRLLSDELVERAAPAA